MWGGGGVQAPGRNNVIYGQEHLKKIRKRKKFQKLGKCEGKFKNF